MFYCTCRDLLSSRQRMVETSILKADLHGCILQVESSQNPSLVGLNGIQIMETKNTWKIVTKDDKLKGKSFVTNLYFKPRTICYA